MMVVVCNAQYNWMIPSNNDVPMSPRTETNDDLLLRDDDSDVGDEESSIDSVVAIVGITIVL
jgi:hypothetical protein